MVSSFPAENFEKAYGASAISKTYVLPEGLDEHMIKDLILSRDESLDYIYTEIYDSNPEIAELITREDDHRIINDRNRLTERGDILYGIATRLNLDDIQYFIDLRCSARRRNIGTIEAVPSKIRLDLERLEYAFGMYEDRFPINWQPSPQTMEKIDDVLKKRFADHPDLILHKKRPLLSGVKPNPENGYHDFIEEQLEGDLAHRNSLGRNTPIRRSSGQGHLPADHKMPATRANSGPPQK